MVAAVTLVAAVTVVAAVVVDEFKAGKKNHTLNGKSALRNG